MLATLQVMMVTFFLWITLNVIWIALNVVPFILKYVYDLVQMLFETVFVLMAMSVQSGWFAGVFAVAIVVLMWMENILGIRTLALLMVP
jgi:hypothetical protein